MIDLNKIRQDTLGCHDKIFMNSAGCSLPPKSVMETMFDYFKQEEMYGGYAVEGRKRAEINQLDVEISTLLNCSPRNIAYAYSASDAYAKALSAIPFERGDYLLTTDDDYISNYIAFISLKKRLGIEILRAKNLENGDLDLADFEQLVVKYKPKLVAITHIPTNSGLVQDAEAVGAICKKYDIWYLLDACQSVGQMVVDAQKIGCDFLNVTGRKFLRGPRASGFLYISDKALDAGLEPLFIDRRGADWVEFEGYKARNDGKRFEEQEISAALIGLAEAVRYANNIGMAQIENYNTLLRVRLKNNLSQNSNLQLLDKGSKHSNLITFHIKNHNLPDIQAVLNEKNVVYTLSLKHFALIDFTKKGVDWAIRLSPHYFNTMDEIDNISDLLMGFK